MGLWVGVKRIPALDTLRDQAEDIAERATERIFADVASYAASRDPALRDDVRRHCLEHTPELLRCLRDGEPPTRESLLVRSQGPTSRHVGRIPIADFLRSFRIYQGVFWDVLLAQSGDTTDGATGAALLGLVQGLLDYISLATTCAAEIYIETEQVHRAGGERVRHDLLEDLVASRPVPPGPRQDAARAAGLAPDRPCLVIVATHRGAVPDEQALRGAAASVAQACRTRQSPLMVLHDHDIVVISPARQEEAGEITAELIRTQARLLRQHIRLAIGVSTVHQGLGGTPSAFSEARSAAQCLGPAGGVLSLPNLSAFEYLASFTDPTAERLISPSVRRFVSADLESGGVLAATLLAYADCNLSVKALSERIHVHVNTAHYRLSRIAEQTRLDLRKLADVLELVIAIRVARPFGDRPLGTWRSDPATRYRWGDLSAGRPASSRASEWLVKSANTTH